jgi:hypothetical protein
MRCLEIQNCNFLGSGGLGEGQRPAAAMCKRGSGGWGSAEAGWRGGLKTNNWLTDGVDM